VSTTAVAPGDVVALYDNDGLRTALDRGGREFLKLAKPPVVMLHTFPSAAAEGLPHLEAVAAEVRQLVPDVRLWLGVGADYALRQLREHGRGSRARIERSLEACGDAAVEIGAEVLMWDPEAAWKGRTPAERAENDSIARGVVLQVAAEHPRLLQAFTSYDHPTYHSTYAWKGWVGPRTPVVLAAMQVYAAPAGEGMAARGALERREARALGSYREAIRKGWIEADLEVAGVDVPEDLDWVPYLQAHSVPARDSVALALRHDVVCWWAAPTRMDAEGRRAMLAAIQLRAAGYRGPDAVRAWQQWHNAQNFAPTLTEDNVAGPKTLAALLGDDP